jgi:predicted metal-binding membrane protein
VLCVRSCAGLTAVLLVLGMMDVRVMAAVTVAITTERLAPAGVHVARAIGVIVIGTGLLQIARASGFG